MLFVLTLTVGIAAYLIAVARWATVLLRGRWRRNATWFAATSALLLPWAAGTYLVGASAGSYDEAEACSLSGSGYDERYAAAHRSDWFPVHHPCNHRYDLVPGWVNPTLVALTALVIGCAAVAALLAARPVR